ncbi:Transcriptional regulator MtlR [Clostridium felsineum]|nr:Transcriptional regulator MtlR [Clostridium felsineum]
MNRRHRDILNLIFNAEEGIAGGELARICNVTVRTIRSDIKNINNLLEKYNVKVESSIKKGYFLNKVDKDTLKKNNVVRSVIDYEYIRENPSDPIERKVYILFNLIDKKYILKEELLEGLHISEATLNNDITAINKWMKENFKLSISYPLNGEITLKANEIEKRNIISWILAIRIKISTVSKYWSYIFDGKNVIEESRKLYHIVNYETKKWGYYLSGHSYQLFCYELLVAINRQKQGVELKEIEGELTGVIASIRNKIEKKFGYKLSKSEWLNLQNCFKSKQFISGTDIKNIETKEAIYVVNEFLKVLYDKFRMDLRNNKDNKCKLLLYIAPMINRLKYRHCISNKIDKNIAKNYKAEFKMAAEIKAIIKRKFNLEVKSIDLAYITIQLVVMCGFKSHSLKTIIVCDYDESIVDFIKYKIKNNFGEKINIARCYDYQEFMYEDKEKLKNVELIITTSTIADLTDIPFIRINPEFYDNDINTIAEYFKEHKQLIL